MRYFDITLEFPELPDKSRVWRYHCVPGKSRFKAVVRVVLGNGYERGIRGHAFNNLKISCRELNTSSTSST